MCTALARIKGEEAAGGNDSSPEFRTGHRRGGDPEAVEKPLYDQYVNVWKRDPLFERIVRDLRLTSVAQRLLGTDRIRLWHDHIISKPLTRAAISGFTRTSTAGRWPPPTW